MVEANLECNFETEQDSDDLFQPTALPDLLLLVKQLARDKYCKSKEDIPANKKEVLKAFLKFARLSRSKSHTHMDAHGF